jgi:hypothetical protein
MHKKFIKILVIAIFLIPLFAQAVVLAPKNSTLPDSRPLQPIPEFVAPNYEHSVDNPVEDSVSQDPGVLSPAESATTEQATFPLKVKSQNWLFILIAIVVGLIFVFTAFSLKKGRQEDKQ